MINISKEELVYYKKFGVSEDSLKKLEEALCDKELKKVFDELEKIKRFNELKVLDAFNEVSFNQDDFYSKSGYSFDDIGREKLEKLYALIFKTEDAVVRPSIISGTHAISLCLNGTLRTKDNFIYATGIPYDTIRRTIGSEKVIKNKYKLSEGSLFDQGVSVKYVPMIKEKIDIKNVLKNINKKTKLIAFQRAIGYASRESLTTKNLSQAIKEIKKKYPNIIIFVDNCYGEFVDFKEPTEIGADIIAGSLIKNLGAGIANGGGYIAGKKELVEIISNKLSAVGLGKEQGPMQSQTLNILRGLFFSPEVVLSALKNATLFNYVYEKLGYKVYPLFNQKRGDIVSQIFLENEKNLIKFCEKIQESSLIDNKFMPVPDVMPGYSNKIIMASGSFIQGSSIELSADAPLRDPYCVYFQGGLNFSQGKLALLKTLDALNNS